MIATSGSKKGVLGTVLHASYRFSDGWVVRWDDTGKKKVYTTSSMRTAESSNSSSSESESSSEESSLDYSDSDSNSTPTP